jgi:hypothetical protein
MANPRLIFLKNYFSVVHFWSEFYQHFRVFSHNFHMTWPKKLTILTIFSQCGPKTNLSWPTLAFEGILEIVFKIQMVSLISRCDNKFVENS